MLTDFRDAEENEGPPGGDNQVIRHNRGLDLKVIFMICMVRPICLKLRILIFA